MDTFFRLLSRCCLFLVAVFAAQAATPIVASADALASTDAPASADGGWPLSPRPAVVRRFEPPQGPWAAGHRGVDLAGAVGQAVLAPVAGTVRFAGAIAGRGVVVLTHGSSRTTYEPVVAAVRVGQVVARGEPLGRLSAAGSHCAPAVCLHWGLLRDEEYVDPLTLTRDQGVRLLPLQPPGEKPVPRLDGQPVLPPGGESLLPPDEMPVAPSGPTPPGSGDGGSAAAGGSAAGGSGGRGDGSAGALAVGLAATAVIGSAVMIRRH